MKRKICLLFFYLLVLTGCIQTNVIEEISLIQVKGLDLKDNGELEMSVSFPTYINQGKESVLKSRQLTMTGHTMKAIENKLNTKSQQPVRVGQAQVFLFTEKIAKVGLEELVSTLYRDPSVRNRAYLAVTDKEIMDIFKNIKEADNRVGAFLPDLIKQEEVHNLPRSNLHLFLARMYNDGRDAFLPLISVDQEVKMIGTALFKGDRFVDRIGLKDSFVMKLLTENGKGSAQEFLIDYEGEDVYIFMRNIASRKKIKLVKGNPSTFIYNVKIKGEITNITKPLGLGQQNVMNRIEASIEDQIAKTGKQLVKKFQTLDIDPLGLGEKYRSQSRDWDAEKWREQYPDVDVKININLEIIESGVIE